MEVKDVWYAYATRKGTPALRGVSTIMEPGKLLALVGLSGSGKSTLVALLERLYDPDEGQVRAFYLSRPLPAPRTNGLLAFVTKGSAGSESCGQFAGSCMECICQARHAWLCLLQAEAR